MYSMTTPDSSFHVPPAGHHCAGGISGTSLPDASNTSTVEQPPEEDKEADSDVSVSGTGQNSRRRKGSPYRASRVLKSGRR